MGKRGGEDQQGACGDGGLYQRQGDLPDDLPLLCPRDAGRFLQRGVHALQGGNHLHEHEGEVIAHFHEHDAPDGVDVDGHALEVQKLLQKLVDIAGAAVEHHVPGHGAEKRREHVGDVEQGAHQALGGDIAAAEKPGVEHAHDGAEDGGKDRDFQGVPHGREVVGLGELFGKQPALELALIEKRVVDDHEDGDDHDDQQQDEADHRHHLVHIQPPAPVYGRKLGADAAIVAHAVSAPFCAG